MISISELLGLMPDTAAIDEHWRRICQGMTADADAAGYERGLREGYLLAIAELKAWQQGVVKDAGTERRRWHLCCPRCRLAGHRDGCPDCADRTRETFSQALPGDLPPGQAAGRTAAS
jgi:hypothetical protein